MCLEDTELGVPKKLEKFLRQLGFFGNSYTLIHGDMKEMAMMTTLAISKPISLLSDDNVPPILPLDHHIINKYASNEESIMFEVDMWPQIQNLRADVISRTAFGRTHRDGSRIFEILKEQIHLFTEVYHLHHIPGWR
ncbi:hypothetical protein CUMW_161190 [Citrus unshiu]|uniref:Uncharacterized protein n=1 Tax=Citrus unshiu TaxID=55188 RepID=A0A2H5PRP7_CITUN|nr:hypothetical protein CUMW_161190 [Citrus unshiu]